MCQNGRSGKLHPFTVPAEFEGHACCFGQQSVFLTGTAKTMYLFITENMLQEFLFNIWELDD